MDSGCRLDKFTVDGHSGLFNEFVLFPAGAEPGVADLFFKLDTITFFDKLICSKFIIQK
jgi:hypothetical protein